MKSWSHGGGVWWCDSSEMGKDESVASERPRRWASDLAPELWGRVAAHLGPQQYMRLLTCSRGLVLKHERDRLWHFFCHFAGYARRSEEGGCWWNGKMPQLHWELLFRENALAARAELKHLFCWLRVGDEELRFAVSQAEAAAFKDNRQGLCHPQLLAKTLCRVVSKEAGAFRLRDLILGRPGFAARAVGFYALPSATKVLAEFLDDSTPLPWRSEASHCESCHGLGRDRWLVELHSVETGTSEWLMVGDTPASAVTVRDLCKAVSARLPALGFRATRCWLSSSQDPQKPVGDLDLGHELLRDLRWTQAERLELRQVSLCRRHPPWLDREEMELSLHCQSTPLVLMRRHSTRLGRPNDSANGSAVSVSGRTICQDLTETESGVSEVPHSRRLLLTSRGVRQFEYHPMRPSTLLVGKKDGTAGIIDYDKDVMTHSCAVDQFPILGLSWFHTLPNWAVVGGSQSGVIRFLRYDEGETGSMHSLELEPFQHLSSLSMNCTDDFFMTSGFCIDVGLYDVITGRRIKTFRNLHQNFINILRFSHRTPQLFATASFDHTCKVWDLRDPGLCADKPILNCPGSTLNVMCSFAPDDSRLLISGVDEELRQFDLRTGSSSQFPVPSLGSSINYRRSLYIAGGDVVATVATNESLLRFYDTSEGHQPLGSIDFRTMLLKQGQSKSPRQEAQSIFRWQGYRPRWGRQASTCEEPPAEAAPRVEYLQSLRCHPSTPQMLSALVAASEPSPEAYVAAVHLEAVPSRCR